MLKDCTVSIVHVENFEFLAFLRKGIPASFDPTNFYLFSILGSIYLMFRDTVRFDKAKNHLYASGWIIANLIDAIPSLL